jgi:hypothetical protein
MDQISRVWVLAKPSQGNPDYKPWQTANVAVFVKASNREGALKSAREALNREGWEIIRVDLSDRLLEQRVQQQGGEVWNLYQQAQSKGYGIKVFPKHFGAGPDGIPTIRPPRVTEAFMDQVVTDIGGCRLEADGATRLVDYRIEDWLFEMKDLQQEGLSQPDRQKKLADLFQPYMTSDDPIQINPDVLDDTERSRYFDIISSPIQGQVKSASKQIRATKGRLGSTTLRGGIIYLNTGYGSFPEDEFGPLVERYARKDTTQIEALLAISTWSVTNGFDSYVYFRAYPPEPEHGVVQRLREAFSHRFEQAMTRLVTGQLSQSEKLGDPLTPVVFNVDGLDFAWLPPEVPATWRQAE